MATSSWPRKVPTTCTVRRTPRGVTGATVTATGCGSVRAAGAATLLASRPGREITPSATSTPRRPTPRAPAKKHPRSLFQADLMDYPSSRAALPLPFRLGQDAVEHQVQDIAGLALHGALLTGEVVGEHRAVHQVAHHVENAVGRNVPDAPGRDQPAEEVPPGLLVGVLV